MKLLLITIFTLFNYTLLFSQQQTVTGTVTNKNQIPLVGVTVQSKTRSVATNANGEFTIPASEGETLTFTFVGMEPATYRVNDNSKRISISMADKAGDLEQIVVTGYKSERKVDLTGAVSVVNLATIKNATTTSPMLALQGQVPGLYIQTDGSPTGGNGNAPTIIVRGVNSLGNTNPLYIIDGVPTTRYEDFANLNTGSIASIQVLKDASASSIYGSRAANGVIVVTTKDGGSASGDKVRIQLNSSITIQSEKPWQENVLNSYDRGAALWRAAVNDGTDPNNLVNKIYTYDWNNNYANPVLNKVNIAPFVGGDPSEPVGNTNWQDALFKKAAVSSNDIAITAGNARSGLLLDLGYYKNNGLIVFTNYERYNARINTHTSLFNNRLKVGENFQISRTSQVNSTSDVGGAATPGLALTLSPTIPLYKTDGTYGGPIGAGYTDRNNPVDMQYLNRWNTTKRVLNFGNVYADLEIIKKLVFHTSVGFDFADITAKVASLIGNEGPVRSFNSLSLQETKDFTFTFTNTLSYSYELGKSRFNFLVGTEAVRRDSSSFGAATTNFAIQDVNYFQLGAGAGAQTTNGGASGSRLLSQFGKIFYGFSDKYLASFTIRRDGSSRFGANTKYGVFPAFSAGWRINNEDFLKSVTAISNLKLRAGYGKVGNQGITGQVADLAPLTLYRANYGTSDPAYPLWLNTGTAYDINGVNTGTLPSGFVQTQRGNPNLKWESTAETDIGIDFGLLKEKIVGSFDYFTRKTTDILVQPPVAAAVGEGQLQYVNGASKSIKGWELLVGYRNSTSGGLGYAVTVNASHSKDIITQLPDNVRSAFPGDANHSIVGHSQFTYFGYKTQGIFQNQHDVDVSPIQPGKGLGRIRYADLNGDGKIDANDQTFLGTTLPKVEFGLRIELNYKNFDLTVFGSGVAGKTAFDPTKFFNSFVNARNNFGPGTLKAWTPQNTSSSIPALTVLNANGEDRISDFYYVNASYFKLRNVSLGYSLPKKISGILKMESLRVYVTGQNLFVIKSKQFTAKDPERANTFDLWPVPTSVTAGLNVNF